MTTLVALIAPQRSTQYAALADALAPYELMLSPLGSRIEEIRPLLLGGQTYLRLELSAALDEQDARELGALAMTSAFFDYYEQLGGQSGPFLRPFETRFEPVLPPDIALTRRYKGKTNELFTQFLCNIARFSSGFTHEPWRALRVFDPLAGGGTTLFSALILGAEAAGVERDDGDVQSTATFVRNYLREQGIAHSLREERLRKLGHRWTFSIGKPAARRLMLASGDTVQSPALIGGFKPHLIVTDLPYGFQHHGELVSLLTAALPVWASLLPVDGTLVFAWDATRFSRDQMIGLVESVSPLAVLNQPPYTSLSHRVDRVIKSRDVIVARPRRTSPPSS